MHYVKSKGQFLKKNRNLNFKVCVPFIKATLNKKTD